MKIGVFLLTSITVLLLISTTILIQNNIQLTNDYDKIKISIKNLENQMANQETLNSEYRESNEFLLHELESQIKRYGDSQVLVGQLDVNLNNLNLDLRNINLQKTELESEIQQRKNEISQLIEDGNAKQNEISSLNQDLRIRLTELDTLKIHTTSLETQINNKQQEIEQSQEQISVLQTSISNLQSRITNLNIENDALENDNEKLQEKYNDVIKGTFLENMEEISQLGESLKDSVVSVESGSARGTGFFVSSNGCIITNAHVTGGRDTFTIELVDGTRLPGELLKEGNYEKNRFFIGEFDIALIKINYYDATPIIISDTAPTPNEIVVNVGHPGRLGHWVIATGHFHGDFEDDFSFELPAFPGSSGSPIVNMNRELVGLLWGGTTWNPIDQNHDDVIWKGNLGEFLTENHYTLAETLFSVKDFLSNTECSIG